MTPRPFFAPGKDQVPIVQEAGWAPGPVWTDEENLALTGIRALECPARGQSLYRLSYRAHIKIIYVLLISVNTMVMPHLKSLWIISY